MFKVTVVSIQNPAFSYISDSIPDGEAMQTCFKHIYPTALCHIIMIFCGLVEG